MRTAVIGSMGFTDLNQLFQTLDQFEITLVVTGKAPGADQLARDYADTRGIPKKVIEPDWKRYGKGAAFVANMPIVDAAERVIAFWDGKSKGTKNALDYASKQGKSIHLVTGSPPLPCLKTQLPVRR